MIKDLRRRLDKDKELVLRIKARPGAASTGFKGVRSDGVLKVDISAPALKNRANRELVRFLAEYLGVDKNNVTLIRGGNTENKTIKVKI